MKTYLKLTFCFTAVYVLFSSCSQVIRRHQDFMDALKTKSDVLQHFGYPNQYRIQDETTEWLYQLDNQNKITASNPEPASKKLNTTEGLKVEHFEDLNDKYVLITFENDSVIGQKSQGVNFSIRKVRPLESVLLGAGLTVALAFGVFAIAYGGGF